MFSQSIEWARLENLSQRNVSPPFDTELECRDFVSDGHAHCSIEQAVTLIGVKEFGIAVVIVPHAQTILNNLCDGWRNIPIALTGAPSHLPDLPALSTIKFHPQSGGIPKNL